MLFFDHFGDFIPGDIGGLLALFLNNEKGATIIHDPRVIWNTIDVVGKCGGQAITSKQVAFVKATMKSETRYMAAKCRRITTSDFAYCDSGIIPWLVVWEYLSVSNLLLSDLISERKNRYRWRLNF